MADITNFISTKYDTIDGTSNMSFVQDFFNQSGFSHFPVVDNGVFVGNIASEDVETFESFQKVQDYKYALEGFFVTDDMVWQDVLQIFAKNETNVLPVLDKDSLYLGYYNIVDIWSFFQETPFFQELGSIILVQKKSKDYSIGEITHIIESNNGKILGLFISESSGEFTQVTVKVGLGAINEIIQSLRRYDYEIISDHFEDNYMSILKERSEYLDKYLNF